MSCTYSVYQYCTCHTPDHVNGNLTNCSCIHSITTKTCTSSGGGGGGGGGSSNNNEDGCQTSGTNILDGQPIAGIGGGCAPNVEVAVNPSVDDTLEKECTKIENLFSNNRTIKTKIQTLATKVTDNKEHSHSFHEDGTEEKKEGFFQSGGIDYPEYASKYKSLAHTHDSYGKDGLGTLSVFSIADLQIIAKLAHFNKLDSGTFVAFLATNDSTNYALTINNKQKLIDLFFAYINEPLTSTNALKYSQSRIKVEYLFKKYFDKDNPDAKLKVDSNDAETDLKEFLNFMSEADLGITLFESTDNFNSFKKVDVKNNTVEREPCN